MRDAAIVCGHRLGIVCFETIDQSGLPFVYREKKKTPMPKEARIKTKLKVISDRTDSRVKMPIVKRFGPLSGSVRPEKRFLPSVKFGSRVRAAVFEY